MSTSYHTYIKSTGNLFFSMDTCIYPVRRCGRALNLPEEWFLTTNRLENTLSAYYDGDLYSCDPNEGREPTMKLGNALQTPLGEMLGDSVRLDVAREEPINDVQ